MSVDVGNNYLKYKNPYKAMLTEKRMLQPRAGASILHIGMYDTCARFTEADNAPVSCFVDINIVESYHKANSSII